MEGEEHIHRRRGWIATIITVLILSLLTLFVIRVLYFADLIRSGELSTSSLDFSKNLSLSMKLAGTTITDGVYNVATTDDPSLGSAAAPIVIVEFADFGCSYSKESSFVVRQLSEENPELVRFVYRDFPLTELHPIAQRASEAGECAQEQGKFWEYHDKVYQNQTSLNEERLLAFAQELNMNTYQFETCLSSGRYTDEVIADYQAGIEAGVQGTPTFFINGNRVAGAIPKEIFDSIIQAVITQEE